MAIIVRIAVNALALWITSEILEDFSVETGFWRIVAVAAIFGFVNAILRPLAVLVSLPAIILTLGLFTIIINAVMIVVTDWLTTWLDVESFGTALLAALIISAVSWVANVILPDRYETKRD